MERSQLIGFQDTGNPVLDSLVNLLAAGVVVQKAEDIKVAHALLCELAQKEPGGLQRRDDCSRA